MPTKKKLQKYQNSGNTGYSWSGSTPSIGIVQNPTEYSVSTPKSTQKDINKRQEDLNKIAKVILDSKGINDFSDEDVAILSQSTLPNVDRVLRDYRINRANRAQERPGSYTTTEGFKESTAALGDKVSLQRLPVVGQYMPDLLDVTGGIGSMAAGLGAIPDNLNKGEYGSAAINLGLPLLTGALGGLGTTTRGQFLNNLVNPLAGTASKVKIKNISQLNDPDAFYRVVVGDDAFNDIIESGVVRVKSPMDKASDRVGLINLDRRGTTAYPSFSKGKVSTEYAADNPNNYIIVSKDKSIKPSTAGRHGKGTTMFPTDETGRHLNSLDTKNVDVYKHIGGGDYQLVLNKGSLLNYQQGGATPTNMKKIKKEKLQKYQNSGPVKDTGFIPSINNIFQQGLGIAPNITNPSGNPFGTNIFGDQLTKGIFDTGQLFKGMPQLNQLETPLGAWGGDTSKKLEEEILNEYAIKYGTVGDSKKTIEAWARENNQDPRNFAKVIQDEAGQRYDNTISAQKTWNEYGKPLAGNMAAMEKLTDMQAVEGLKGNKRALYDVTDEMKGVENRGVFQSGGAPQINALQQVLGYKDNSPFKKLPSQTILRNMSADGVNITMDGVSKDLYLIPDSGRPVLAKGNSGEYFFPKANAVQEIPAYQNSGAVALTDTISNNKRLIGKLNRNTSTLKAHKDIDLTQQGIAKRMVEDVLKIEDLKRQDGKGVANDAGALKRRYNLNLDEKELQTKLIDLYNRQNYKEALDLVGITEGDISIYTDNLLAVSDLVNEYGVKELKRPQQNRLRRIIGNSGFFDPSTDTIYARDLDEIVEEVAHAKQKKDGMDLISASINEWIKDPHISESGYRRRYKTPGSMEYQAHSVIAPKLHEDVTDKRKKFAGIFQQGGYPFLPTARPILKSELNDEEIKAEIKRHEGAVIDKSGRHNIYKDSEGYNTIGYGHLWRPIEPLSINQEQADAIFDRDYERHKAYAEQIPGWDKATPEQKKALINLTFNMGEGWYKKFPKFTEAMKKGDYNSATKELKDSLWYQQVGPRANDVIRSLSNGNTQSFQSGGSVSPSLRKRIYKIVQHEKKQGGIDSGALLNAGIKEEDVKKWIEKKYGVGSKQSLNYISDDDAVDYIIENYLPKVKGLNTEDEIFSALDLQFNGGKDARIFAYQEWLRAQDPNNTTGWMDEDKRWKDRNNPPPNFDKLYNESLGKLKDEERLDLIDKGRNWYYKNIYRTGSGKGVGYWDRTKTPDPNKDYFFDKKDGYYYERGADGSLSPGYGRTWRARTIYTKPEKGAQTSVTTQPQQPTSQPQTQQTTAFPQTQPTRTQQSSMSPQKSGRKKLTTGPTGRPIKYDTWDFYDEGDGTYTRVRPTGEESSTFDYETFLKHMIEEGGLTWQEEEQLLKNRPKKREQGGPTHYQNGDQVKYDHLTDGEKLNYVKLLKGYVDKYGFESLAESDYDAAMFLQEQLEVLRKGGTDPKKDTIIGGDVTGDEDIVISAKRKKDRSGVEIPALPSVRERLMNPVQLENNDNLFREIVEGFKEQKSAAQREQEYKRRLQLMFAEQNRQKQQEDSNIYTGRGRYAKEGGTIQNFQNSGRATLRDSLDVYNNSVLVNKYYKDKGYSVFSSPGAEFYDSENVRYRDRLKKDMKRPGGYSPRTNRLSGTYESVDKKFKEEEYYQKIDNNRYKQRELAYPILDLRSPMQLFDKRIKPQKAVYYSNENKSDSMYGDNVSTYMYDPVAVKPVSMLTPAEMKIRKQKYPDSFGTETTNTPNRTVSKGSSPTSKTVIIKPKPRQSLSINQLDTIKPELFNIPQRDVDIRDPYDYQWDGGEMMVDAPGMKGLKIVMMNRKSDGDLLPAYYENEAGERIPYNSVITKKFRNPGKFQSGGIPILNLSKNINPMRLNPQGLYKMGGLITEGSEYNKRKQPKKNTITGASSTGPMGPKDMPSYDGGIRAIIDQEKNEIIPTENLIPIQTEKGELIVLPTGDVVPVMAKRRHHQMDEDEVTDVAPEGAYILSSFGRVKIKKKEAENVIAETGVKPYKLGIGQETPTEKTLGDIMTKKEMAPAEVGKLISRRFPVIATDNPYEAAANTENKINRRPYLEGLIQLSEFDKIRKGIDTSTPEATREYRDEEEEMYEYEGGENEIEEMMQGGNPMFRRNIPHAKDPLTAAAIQAGSGLIQSITSIIGSAQQRKAADQAYRDVLRMSNQSADRQRGQLGLGAAAGILGTLSQDPTVNAAYLNPTYINQMQTRTPSQITDSVINTAYANMPTYSNLAPQQQMLASQAAWGQALKAAGDARMNAWAGDRAAKNQQLQSLQQYYNTNENNRVAAQNATRLNRNQQIGNVGDRTQGYFDSTATIEANLGQTQANARLGQGAAQQQAIRSYTQGINQAIGTAGAAAYDLYANKSTPIGTNTTRLDQPALNSYPQTTLQPSPDCMWIGGKWINMTTGLPC